MKKAVIIKKGELDSILASPRECLFYTMQIT